MYCFRLINTIACILAVNALYSQTVTIRGRVSDTMGNRLFAVNIYLSHDNSIGTTSDFDGNFALKIFEPINKDEKLVISFIGYESVVIPLEGLEINKPLTVTLLEDTQILSEVIVEGRKSISREFSVKELDKMDIYLSPLASADPLKAIAMLPSSTNTNETANPELRGSNANRTKVLLNGVPISNPVRNSQINGIGFFSLFNPELIKNMQVYPSNPPLIYGNTSAGIVDIETENKLKRNNYQLSASLASMGVLASQIINDKSFFQVYGNLMFSDGYLFVNPNIEKQIKEFSTNDLGLNFHCELSKKMTINFYNYLLVESSDVLLNLFTWEDNAEAKRIRDFSVLNIQYNNSASYIFVNLGTDISSSDFHFGNIVSSVNQRKVYSSLNYKYLFSELLSMQAGLSSEIFEFSFDDEMPVFYYATSPASPTYKSDTTLLTNLTEAYLYIRWKPFNALIWSAGARSNLGKSGTFGNQNINYLSLQTNFRYNLLNAHSVIFSIGKYNSISEPNYMDNNFRLLSSNQVALEYLFEKRNTNINLAAYFKSEKGDLSGSRKIKGFEVLFDQYISRSLRVGLTNTMLNSEISNQNVVYNSDNSVGYFLSATLSYYNHRFFNISASWTHRKGKLYTPINASIYNSFVDFYQPIFSDNFNSKRHGSYNTINISLNRMFSLNKKHNIILYASIINLLNTNNQKNIIYSKDYSTSIYEYYQKRSLYFGVVMSLN